MNRIDERIAEFYEQWSDEDVKNIQDVMRDFYRMGQQDATASDPAKQCYHDEGQCACQIPQTCVIDDGQPFDCSFSQRLIEQGKGRDDCEHWGKK